MTGISRKTRLNCENIHEALSGRDMDLEEILEFTGMDEVEFKRAYRMFKRHYCPQLGVTTGYNRIVRKYQICQLPEDAFTVAAERMGDSLTRLTTIDRGVLDGMLTQSLITPRLHRAIIMATEEYEDQVQHIQRGREAANA